MHYILRLIYYQIIKNSCRIIRCREHPGSLARVPACQTCQSAALASQLPVSQPASQGAGLPDLPGSSQPGCQPYDQMILLSYDLMILWSYHLIILSSDHPIILLSYYLQPASQPPASQPQAASQLTLASQLPVSQPSQPGCQSCQTFQGAASQGASLMI